VGDEIRNWAARRRASANGGTEGSQTAVLVLVLGVVLGGVLAVVIELGSVVGLGAMLRRPSSI
jgi:hypothetical protein